LAQVVRQLQPQQQGVITVLILCLTQSHRQVAVEEEQKIRLLEMAGQAAAHPRLAVEQLLELELLVKEIMAVQVMATLPLMLLLVVAAVLVQ
jgi:hypothetical protein